MRESCQKTKRQRLQANSSSSSPWWLKIRPPQRETPPTKKPKRGSWRAQRSGNSEKLNTGHKNRPNEPLLRPPKRKIRYFVDRPDCFTVWLFCPNPEVGFVSSQGCFLTSAVREKRGFALSFLWIALIIGLTFLLSLLLLSEEEKGPALKPSSPPDKELSQAGAVEVTSKEQTPSPVLLDVQPVPLSSAKETSGDEHVQTPLKPDVPSKDSSEEDKAAQEDESSVVAAESSVVAAESSVVAAGDVLPTGEVMTVTAHENLLQELAAEASSSLEEKAAPLQENKATVPLVEEASNESSTVGEDKAEESPEQPSAVEMTKQASPLPTSPRKSRKQPTGQRSPLGHYSRASLELVGRWLDTPVHRLEEVLVSIRRQTAYRHFELEKVHSDETRLIQAPIEPLRLLQRRILERLVYTIPCSNAAHGAVPGRSVVTNAAAHLPSAREVLNLDLRKAFPSVRFARVRGVFRPLTRELLKKTGQLDAPVSSEVELKEETAHLLTALTTSPLVEDNGRTVYVLPQGAPTSGALLNLVCRELDRKIFKICKQHSTLKLRYTRYLDDLTLSSPAEIPAEVRREVEHAILKNGFKDNSAKTKHLREGNVLQICGLRLEGRKLEVSPQIVSRCALRLEESKHRGHSLEEESQHRTAVFGIINFFRMVYGSRIPDSIAAPYKEYRSNRNLGREKEAQLPHALPWSPRGAEEQTGLSLLAQWLDVSVEELEFVKQMVEEGEAYLRWSIPKRNGQHRQIMTPYYELKRIQARLLRRLLYRIPVSDAAHGFVPARSIVTNAYAHCHRDHLLNIDLKDAFPSPHWPWDTTQKVRSSLFS